MAGMRLGGGREVRSDGRESEVVLKGDNGWVVDQQGIDGYGNVGYCRQWDDFGAQEWWWLGRVFRTMLRMAKVCSSLFQEITFSV